MAGLLKVSPRGRGILLLLAGVALGWSGGGILSADRARAQIPDSGAQRNEMVRELRAIRGELKEIRALLKSGDIAVRLKDEPVKGRAAGSR